MTRDPRGPQRASAAAAAGRGQAACWCCGEPVSFGRLALECLLHGRPREEGGPWRSWRCPSCREENGALPGPSGGWLLHPLEGLVPPGLLGRLRTSERRRRLADAEAWWAANRLRVERFRRGLDGAPASPHPRGRRAGGPRSRRPATARRSVAASGPRAVLGVSEDASLDEIRRAFRRSAKRLHPDRAPRDAASQAEAHRRFRELRAAFEALASAAGES